MSTLENINETITNKKAWTIYLWVVFLASLFSLHSYFFWHVDAKMTTSFFAVSCFLILLFHKSWVDLNIKNTILVIFLFIAKFYTYPSGNYNILLLCILSLTPIFTLMLLQNKYKVFIYDFFSKIFVIILFISLVGWVMYLIGLNLPCFPDFYGEASEQSNLEHQYIFNNYFVYVVNMGWGNDISALTRFSSIFLEPGYFSILLVFLLYIGKFDLSYRKNKIYIVALILTMSLAGYLMAFFAFIATQYVKGDIRQTRRLLIVAFVISILFLFFENLNNGDNIVNKVVLSRLEYDSSKGNIVGYNRTTDLLDEQYSRLFLNGHYLFGEREFDQFANGVGFKAYIVLYGIVGTLLFFISIYLPYFFNRNRNSFFLFLLFLIMFIRGHHVIYYTAFWLIYITGMAKMNFEDKNNINSIQ